MYLLQHDFPKRHWDDYLKALVDNAISNSELITEMSSIGLQMDIFAHAVPASKELRDC